MAARKAREEAANMSMYVPGMPSVRPLPNHFDALSPVGRMNPARPLAHELSFDSYDSRSRSRNRSSDRNDYENRRSRTDYDDRRSRTDYDDRRSRGQYDSRERSREDSRHDLRSQSEWSETPNRKKVRYNHS